ncbi:MAG: DUF177 domain-containing protein [Elusimicrobiota bacterium]
MSLPLRFSIGEIQAKQGLKLAGEIPSESLVPQPPAESRLSKVLTADIRFSVGGNSVLLQAVVEGAWTLPCSRCLSEHLVRFAAQVEETYPSSGFVDIAEDLRQAVLLELPSRSLCAPACKGLCPRCGRNLNDGPCACGAKA